MQPKLCVKCKKNVAVVFITRVENGIARNEGVLPQVRPEAGDSPD